MRRPVAATPGSTSTPHPVRENPRADARRGFRSATAPRGDRLGHQQALPQVEPIEPRQVHAAPGAPGGIVPISSRSARTVASAAASPAAVRKGPTWSAITACSAANSAAVLRAGPVAAVSARAGAAAAASNATPCSVRQAAALRPARAAEDQGLGDRIAGEPVGAVRAADRFAGGKEARHARRMPVVHADAAHVVVRDRRHLDRLPREVDAVRRQASMTGPKAARSSASPQMPEGEPRAAVRRAAARPRPP